MILETPFRHFNEDIQRAKVIFEHSKFQTNGMLKDDLKRTAWMMGVGAVDAFFCDAFGDLLARTLRAKQIEPAIELPERVYQIKIPAISAIRSNPSDGWRWRMVARDVIEKDNVLSINKIQELLNQFFRDNKKIVKANSGNFEKWILHSDSQHRLFGVYKTNYRVAKPQQKTAYKKDAVIKFKKRFELIFQRRHDCIHNCDRPRVAVQSSQIQDAYVQKVLSDLEFLVNRINEDLRTEFPVYLNTLGFNAVTRNRVGA